MKKILPFILITLAFGCKKFDKKTQFDFQIEQDITVPSTIGMQLPFNIPTYDVNTTIDHQLDIHDKRNKKIEHIFITSLVANILSPASQNFNFIKNISIKISAEDLPEIKVAEANDLTNSNKKTLSIPVNASLDLSEYIKKDKINVITDITTDETIFQDITIKIIPTFFVDVKVLGI